MSFPFEYDHGAPLAFGGALPHVRSFDESKVVILPVPVDRTTSYIPGTRNSQTKSVSARSSSPRRHAKRSAARLPSKRRTRHRGP